MTGLAEPSAFVDGRPPVNNAPHLPRPQHFTQNTAGTMETLPVEINHYETYRIRAIRPPWHLDEMEPSFCEIADEERRKVRPWMLLGLGVAAGLLLTRRTIKIEK